MVEPRIAKQGCNGIISDYCERCEARFICWSNKRYVKPLPDYGDHMTIDNFIRACKSGMFVDYDGHGVYATRTEMTTLIVHPSDIIKGNIDRRWTYVVWFNK